MATNGWNLAHFGRDQSRPYQTGSSSTVIACRICDKIFLSTPSLLKHYESHQGDFVHQRQNQNPQRTNVWDFHRERSNPFQQRAPQPRPHSYFPSGYRASPLFHASTQYPFFVPQQNPQVTHPRSHHLVTTGSSGSNVWDFHRERSNPFQQRGPQARPHPYFPSGYQATPSFLVSTQNPFFVPTQNSQVTYPRSNHLVSTGSAGRASGASASQLVINRPIETPGSLLGPPVRLEYQKGYDESADKRTKWYLGQLERPFPKIIDQGNYNRSHSTSYRF